MDRPLINRRSFLKQLGVLGSSVLVSSSPWLSTFSSVYETKKEIVHIGFIGTGSRGRFLMSFLTKNPKAEIVAIADIYKPSIDEARKIAPKAKIYHDYRQMLEDKNIDAVVIATPLNTHYHITMDAFDADKNIYCEKAIAYSMSQCFKVYQKHISSGKIFFTGQQRLFDPRYITAMDFIHKGTFGKIASIHAFWNRNNNWRRPVPDSRFEKLINWRLYKTSSKGLMTELACHQLQIGTWALGKLPEKVMGHGSITYWKDGREVYDNISCIYVFNTGENMTYESTLSNKFYGLEEQILGSKGTVEPEKGKYYFEDIDPAPAFLQMINNWEDKIFNSTSFVGTSWVPDTANENHGEYLIGKRPETDGTSLALDAFIEACIQEKQPPRIAEEGYYASLLALVGYEAIKRQEIVTFPEEYKIDYDAYHTKHK